MGAIYIGQARIEFNTDTRRLLRGLVGVRTAVEKMVAAQKAGRVKKAGSEAARKGRRK